MAVSGVLLMAPACHECGRRSRAIEQLRGLLVASSLLPADLQRPVDLLDLPRLLAGLDGSDRRTVASWVRWQVLAPLRRPATRRHDFDIAVRKARRRLRQAVEFTAQLHRDGRQLAQTQQTDIDAWSPHPAPLDTMPGRS